jgi:hypothetical protein
VWCRAKWRRNDRKKIAINCVMAGCRPEYVPIVIAALEAMLEERFNLNGVQTTTHACAPLAMVSGPAVKTLGFNTQEGSFGMAAAQRRRSVAPSGSFCGTSAAAFPASHARRTLGHPGYFSFVLRKMLTRTRGSRFSRARIQA